MKVYILLWAVLVSLLFSCNDSKMAQQQDILVKYGERYLTRGDVISKIPEAMTGVDSVKMAEALINDWVKMELMTNVAMRNVRDEKRINELVSRYRNNLIIEQYRANMIMENDSLLVVDEDSIRGYYEANRLGMKLSSPIVKGLFVKIAAEASGANTLKRLLKSNVGVDSDEVESILAMEAIGYDRFYDRWTTWEWVESVIPYAFGSADAFLRGNKYLEFTANGVLYILVVSDYLLSNEIMPYEYAVDGISEIFILKNQRRYDERLRDMLYEQGISSGKLKFLN